MKDKFSKLNSTQLLSYFVERERTCFDIDEVYTISPDTKKGTIREMLSDMNRRGLLSRIKDGTYLIVPFGKDKDTYLPEWHLLANCLVKNADHYIGYYSALQIHNLITQPSLKEQIVVSKQQSPSSIQVVNVKFQFIYHNKDHFFGTKKIWINSYDKVICSDLEKTIIDCLFKPDYAGGIVEVARAIFESREKINYDQLLNYATKFKSQAVYKRLGYILELLEIQTPIVGPLLKLRSNSYAVLDTELPKEGKRQSRWRIQKNIDEQTIKSAQYT